MKDKTAIVVKDLGPINNANINLGKITVVAGHNACGKSSLSKLLYSFFRSNSFNRQEIAYGSISELMGDEAKYISTLLKKHGLTGGISLNDFSSKRFNPDDWEGMLENYGRMKEALKGICLPENLSNEFDAIFSRIDSLIGIVCENQNPLYVSLMRSLLEMEFSTKYFNTFFEIANGSFRYTIDLKNHEIGSDEAFRADGTLMINNVFYMDSVSILDTFEFREKRYVDHLSYLKSSLVNDSNSHASIFDDIINENIIAIENEIEDIINGKFIYEKGEFLFVSEGVKYLMQNTSSGIKQIGIIQLLLNNRKLKENSFLIIDEPEVNLHPEWQLRLARILTLLALKLNIHIYINSHSPIFVESMYTYSQYYDMGEVTTYHLASQCEDSFKSDISEVDVNDLARIYDNLGNPYLEMDVISLEKKLGESVADE